MLNIKYHHVQLHPNEQIGLHEQDSWELSLILHGHGMRTTGNCTSPFSANDLVLVPPHMPHRWAFDKEPTGMIENISLMMGTNFFEVCASVFPEFAPIAEVMGNIKGAVVFDSHTRHEISTLLVEMNNANEAMRIAMAMQIGCLIARNEEKLQVIAHPKVGKIQERIEKIRIYVSCNLQKNITVYSVATHVGMNRSAFCRFFKEQTGQTFITWLNAHRISHACKLLKTQDISVGQAAYLSGFNDTPYFIRLFKQMKGLTPMQYKKNDFVNEEKAEEIWTSL